MPSLLGAHAARQRPRVIEGGAVMKVFRCLAIVLPLAIAAAGCSRDEPKPVTAPEPAAAAPSVQEAHWIDNPEALSGAVRVAQASPLVQRAISDTPIPRLTPMPQYAVRAVGSLSDGSRAGMTILPFIAGHDSTHAVFITLLEHDGHPLAEVGELILGRAPTSLETGFVQIMVGGRVGWFRGGSTYGPGLDGSAKLSSERWRAEKFNRCFLENAGIGCQAGSGFGRAIAPEIPAAASIGCGLGVAAVAVGCAIAAFF